MTSNIFYFLSLRLVWLDSYWISEACEHALCKKSRAATIFPLHRCSFFSFLAASRKGQKFYLTRKLMGFDKRLEAKRFQWVLPLPPPLHLCSSNCRENPIAIWILKYQLIDDLWREDLIEHVCESSLMQCKSACSACSVKWPWRDFCAYFTTLRDKMIHFFPQQLPLLCSYFSTFN